MHRNSATRTCKLPQRTVSLMITSVTLCCDLQAPCKRGHVCQRCADTRFKVCELVQPCTEVLLRLFSRSLHLSHLVVLFCHGRFDCGGRGQAEKSSAVQQHDSGWSGLKVAGRRARKNIGYPYHNPFRGSPGAGDGRSQG